MVADNQAGAACATGDGDQILRFCPSHHVVLLMGQGMTPTQACEEVVKRIEQKVGADNIFEIGLIAMNVKVLSVTLKLWR